MTVEASVRALQILEQSPMSAESLAKLLYPEIKDERQLNRTTSILSWQLKQGRVRCRNGIWSTT